MNLKTKIGFTLMFILGFFILKKMSKRNKKRLESRLEKMNPAIVYKATWFFSKKKRNMLNYFFGIILFIFLILIWTNVVVIPVK